MFANKVSYPYFFKKEFPDEKHLDAFLKDVADAFSEIAVPVDGDRLTALNKILSIPSFFLIWQKKIDQNAIPENIQNKANKLKDVFNQEHANLSDKMQYRLACLNRLILETHFPSHCPHRPKWKDDLLELVDDLIIAALLAVVFRAFIFQPYKIPSGSMRMTLIEGDHLFVNKLRYGPRFIPVLRVPNFNPKVTPKYWDLTDKLPTIKLPGFGKPERGDVIIFVAPHDKSKDFIKRLVAFGGETVEIRHGDVFVNDKRVDIPEIRDVYYTNAGSFGEEGRKFFVPEGHYFVLGDNSRNSQDSRYWGFVPEDLLIGRAELIFLPVDRMRFIK